MLSGALTEKLESICVQVYWMSEGEDMCRLQYYKVSTLISNYTSHLYVFHGKLEIQNRLLAAILKMVWELS